MPIEYHRTINIHGFHGENGDMEPLSLSTEGMPDAEQMLLSMIFSFASDQLTRSWTIKQGGNSHVVIYDFTNAQARSAWEQNRTSTHPIPVALSEDPLPNFQWVLQKPIRTQRLIPFLNQLSDWMSNEGLYQADTLFESQTRETALSTVKKRLATLSSMRPSRAGSLQDLKLIISGSLAAGKSSAIRAISDVPSINAHAPTAATIDYGELALQDGKTLRLFGIGGQQRFSSMSKILGHGAIGLMVLIDNRVADPLSELDHYTTLFSDLISETAMVVGVTHCDQSPAPMLNRYKQHLEAFHKPWALFSVDPRRKSDIVLLLDALVTMLGPAQDFNFSLNQSCTEVFERTLENHLAKCDALELAIVATADGQLRAQRQRGSVNTEQTARTGSSLMALGHTLLRDLRLGACATLLTESPQGFALVTSIADSYVLISMTRSKNGLDSLLAEARQTAEEIAQSLPVGNGPPTRHRAGSGREQKSVT